MRKGFSLMEIMVAVFIFAVGILALVGSLPWLLKSEKTAEMYTKAWILAERYMGEIRAADYGNLGSFNDASAQDAAGYPGYQYRRTVADADNASYGSNLRKITVNITWSSHGQSHTYALIDFIAAGQ